MCVGFVLLLYQKNIICPQVLLILFGKSSCLIITVFLNDNTIIYIYIYNNLFVFFH